MRASSILAPASTGESGLFPFSATTIVIILIVAGVGLFFALGWRAPDRPPGADGKAERERIDD